MVMSPESTAGRPPRMALPQFWDLNKLRPSAGSLPHNQTWSIRANEFVVRFVLSNAREEFVRRGQLEEYMVVASTPESRVTIVSEAGEERVSGRAVIVVPPGDSRVTVEADSQVVWLFGSRAGDEMDGAQNAWLYRKHGDETSASRAWPAPSTGYALRVYQVDDYPKDERRLGRIFQSTIGMVNFFYPEEGPRDDTALTPHAHEDFDQCTIHLQGDYVHHVRSPWSPRLADWLPDEHRWLPSPGVVVIPAQCVHTSQAVHEGVHQLIDFFSPPRRDWASQSGWVLNADDYSTVDHSASGVRRDS